MLTDPYLVKRIKNLETSNKKPYLVLELISTNKTPMHGVVWEPEKITDESVGSLLEGSSYVFDAEESDYNGQTQLTIHWAEPIIMDQSSFMKTAPRSSDDMLNHLTEILKSVKTHSFRAVVKGFLTAGHYYFEKLKSLPKTVNYDYSYPGGLLENVLYMTSASLNLAQVFNLSQESRDLLVTAALVIDLGKITEISSDLVKTSEGSLMGHQYLGCKFLEDIDKETDYEFHGDILKLEHCVMTHHIDDLGNWSQVKVQFLEADLIRMISQTVFLYGKWNLSKP